MGSSQSREAASASPSAEKSLYRRVQDSKRGPPLSDDDIKKYTGKTRAELEAWAATRPGVGKNQLAGNTALANASGLGGVAAGEGLGGWGPDSAPRGPSRGMKFLPRPEAAAGDEPSRAAARLP